MLKKVKLGAQGLEVSRLGLGCMGMSQSYYGPADEAESLATIHLALELGVDFFDTAEAYGPYENEKLLGKALKGRRSQVVIATKFGWQIENGKWVGLNSRPEHIRQVVDSSLQRLGTDYIDLLYQHRVDPKIPIEEVVGTMSELVEKGKVRFIGLSEAGASTIKKAHAVHPLSTLQSEYSLWERNLEAEIIPLLRELGIGLVAFSPLGRGFLTGEAKKSEEYSHEDYRRNDPRFQGENFQANLRAAGEVKRLAENKGVTPAQIAIAWVLAKGKDIVPIPGTKRRKYLEDNLRAAELELTPGEIAELEERLPATSGPRYSPWHQALIDR